MCNAMRDGEGGGGFERFLRGTMLHCRPGMPAMVGRARTAKIAGQKPPKEPSEIIKASI